MVHIHAYDDHPHHYYCTSCSASTDEQFLQWFSTFVVQWHQRKLPWPSYFPLQLLFGWSRCCHKHFCCIQHQQQNNPIKWIFKTASPHLTKIQRGIKDPLLPLETFTGKGMNEGHYERWYCQSEASSDYHSSCCCIVLRLHHLFA